MFRRWMLGLTLTLLVSEGAFAALASVVDITGKVTDFDSHYVFLENRSDRYRINRSAVPATIELHPGSTVTVEVAFTEFRIVPATAPATINNNYKPPRKRTPADQTE